MAARSHPLVTLMLTSMGLYAQAPEIQWQHCIGGIADETGISLHNVNGGGYVVAGLSTAVNGDITCGHGGKDVWLAHVDEAGGIGWQQCLGGSADDVPWHVRATADGGSILAGTTYSSDGDVSGHHGDADGWVVRVDGMGVLIWQRALGGSAEDKLIDVMQTLDGGFLAVGYTASDNGDVVGAHGSWDAWVLKLDADGNLLWQTPLGGSDADLFFALTDLSQGYLLAGETHSTDGDVSGNHGGDDAWLVKINEDGSLGWQLCVGGSGHDGFRSLARTPDGNAVIVGNTTSTNGDVQGNHGSVDAWMVKLNGPGNIAWSMCFGGSESESLVGVTVTASGHYAAIGVTSSDDMDVTGHHDDPEPFVEDDAWVVDVDDSGALLWQKCLGGFNLDRGYQVVQCPDLGFLCCGHTASQDGDVEGHLGVEGSADLWLVKLGPYAGSTGVSDMEAPGILAFPNPCHATATIAIPSDDVIDLVLVNSIGVKLDPAATAEGHRLILDTGGLAPGVYAAAIRTRTGIRTARIMIE
jgi:hypothetical protein